MGRMHKLLFFGCNIMNESCVFSNIPTHLAHVGVGI
jgi:hypothetical protein